MQGFFHVPVMQRGAVRETANDLLCCLARLAVDALTSAAGNQFFQQQAMIKNVLLGSA